MTITGINGKLRQGKGILLTKLALDVADSGGAVLSNYSMDSPNVKLIDFYDLISLLMQPRARQRTLIALDEIQGWLDSYVGQTKSGRIGSYFVFQSAKLGYDLAYTTQLTMRAQNTLRELCDVRIYAVKDEQSSAFYYLHLDPMITDDDVPTGSGFQITFEEASQWWGRYNTWEGVVPIGMEEVFAEMEKYDPNRMNQTVNKNLQLLVDSGADIDATTIGVKSALLDLGEIPVFCDLTAHRLKLHKQKKRRPLQQKQIQNTQTMKKGWKLLSESQQQPRI